MNILDTFLSHAAPKTASDTSSKLPQTVQDAVASVSRSQEKTAAAKVDGVEAGLDKLAAAVSTQETNETIKVAELVGRTMADGFVSQLGMYEKVAAEMTEKTASTAQSVQGLDAETVQLVKMAQQDPEGFLALIEKQAAELTAAENASAQELETRIFKTASLHYQEGYRVAASLLQGA